jgi:hypothetical protein
LYFSLLFCHLVFWGGGRVVSLKNILMVLQQHHGLGEAKYSIAILSAKTSQIAIVILESLTFT